ncbi:glycosyltransferase family 2 protein [Dothidotthia symphoricarpi CBS 119687]|uniref:Glycosyltransferase family 2 protein n=1 Tax=Dothidotthia symphoricarpi CBS 119687 TaxID=1392245 RepID=A0A6A6AN64_9PLEO|nr:glycosyltransferase family 2 protein [Dothidotthia symphoricarpi CBS 119687]KAF2132327.1 glycosyltransferase family 2 protein [Dothidotthia symphoricarpi CBS 119687]
MATSVILFMVNSMLFYAGFISKTFATTTVDGPIILGTIVLCLMILWTSFLIFDVRRRPNPPSTLRSLGLLCHNIPAAFFLGTAIVTQHVNDKAMFVFGALMIFRYWRTLVNVWYWFQYKPAVAPTDFKITSADCTVIVPTVGPVGNTVYDQMVTSILMNHPARLIFSTNTDSAAEQVNAALPLMLADIAAGHTVYQKQHGIGPIAVTTDIKVLNARVSNKRQQVVHGFKGVETDILIMVDDTAIWHPRFLEATLPAFASEKVGFVGTRKWVKRLPHPYDPKANFFVSLWKQYQAGFWNTIGGLYLVRHNFEIRATNAADGGVFCVSGRSSLIRTSIVNNDRFTDAFLHEYILHFGDHFPGWGPVTADDDNFLTRWVINNGWNVKIQCSEEATMTTVLGQLPLKFPDQCKRWSRTTFRQNPIALFVDRTVWWKWPLTVWTTYFPWMYNAALVWDSLSVYAFTQTNLYAESSRRVFMLGGLVAFIWMTKLVKTIPWFWAYPVDFFLYFLLPAYPLFTYYHSLLKIWTVFTFWDLAWSGRKLPARNQ